MLTLICLPSLPPIFLRTKEQEWTGNLKQTRAEIQENANGLMVQINMTDA